jgi:hypothetical protein
MTSTDFPVPCTTCHGPASGHQVGANSFLPLPCGTCTNQCNITITIDLVDGNSATGGTADFSNTSPVSFSGSGSCGTSFSIVYDPFTKTFTVS